MSVGVELLGAAEILHAVLEGDGVFPVDPGDIIGARALLAEYLREAAEARERVVVIRSSEIYVARTK